MNQTVVDNLIAHFELDVFAGEFRQTVGSVVESKRVLKEKREEFYSLFRQDEDVRELIAAQSIVVDAVVSILWESIEWPADEPYSLVAVGGYGRGELHPYSDVDLLILLDRRPPKACAEKIEQFVMLLWDCGFDLGHSVRTVSDCVDLAKDDITVLTNLLESRIIVGDQNLFLTMKRATDTDKMWSVEEFFLAKWQEQKDRHRRTDNTEYNLEPNIKESPGGLRDIQTIIWIAKRYSGHNDISRLSYFGILNKQEAEAFKSGIDFLWKARFALHMIAERHEDRLLFEYQAKVANLFGFTDDNANLAVEKFMREYYRTVASLEVFNEVLMQNFNQEVVRANEPSEVFEINDRFCVRDGYIDVTESNVFFNTPEALLEIFCLMAENPYIVGIRSRTIRLMRKERNLIDESFRQNPNAIAMFRRLLASGKNVPMQLRRMHQYGILSKYLPAFAQITGQMQFDLFHIYTTDIHTLEVVQNIYKFAYEGSEFDYVLAAKILNGHLNIEILYLGALFHDIAKGRGGDHSELGVVDAREFCTLHGYNAYEINVVCWLVEVHLLMSSFSQKQDLGDPDAIREFATKVSDRSRLDYLFVLTVADINGTNPELWNAWRASLLRQLYAGATRALRRGLENTVDKGDIIESKKSNAKSQLLELGYESEEVDGQWEGRLEEYFLRESIEDLVSHADAIFKHEDDKKSLVIVKEAKTYGGEDVTQITLYSKRRENRFTRITRALEQLGLSVQDARLYLPDEDHFLDTFYVTETSEFSFSNIEERTQRYQQIKQTLQCVMDDVGADFSSSERIYNRRMKSFKWGANVELSNDYAPGFSVIELVAPDHPGLLAVIGQVIFDQELRLHNAKISTLGERVEDVFFVTDRADRVITDESKKREICEALTTALDANTKEKVS